MKKVAFVLFVFAASCSTQPRVSPQVKPLMEAVYASGFVVSDDEYQVYSQADGIVKDILRTEGENVRAGDGLVSLESNQQDARYTLAREAFELAKLNAGAQSPPLMEAENLLKSARSKFQLDSANFVRFTNLWKANATTKVEFDRAKLAYANATNDWKSAQMRVERTRNDLMLAYRQAESQLRITSEESGNYLVRSKIDGMVFKLTKGKGELVRRGELIAVVGKRDHFHLQLTVDELDVNRVKEGQAIVVQIEAYPDQLFHGTVTRIFPLIDVRQQSLRVDASLREDLPGWFSGLAVEANIILQQKEKTLVLPKSLLLAGDSVLVSTPDGPQKVKIKKGIETMEEVEILEGLDERTELIVPKK